MDVAVSIGSRLRRVRVVPQDGRLTVTVDGRSLDVDVRPVGGAGLSLLVTEPGGAAGGASRSVDAAVTPLAAAGAFDVYVAGRRIPVEVETGRFGGRAGLVSGGAGGPLRVTAPMPGKIVRVLVRPGDDVRARQGLIVVEAMKMENELRAARDGRVRAVAVEEGQSVDAGTLLVELEPAL